MSSYSIKQLELVSGIKAHTIRMWERRYGLFSPHRTNTNIRRYNEQDVQLILNIALLLRNGYRISKLAAKIPEELNNLVLNISVKESTVKESDLEPFLLDLFAFNQQAFKSNLNKKIDDLGLEVVFEKIILPLLERVGILWQTGMIKPVHEHFVSSIIKHTIIVKYELLKEPKSNAKTILFFLPEGEYHEIGILMYAFVAKKMGLNTFYLGQSTPINDLIEVLNAVKPSIIFSGISTSLPEFEIEGITKDIKKSLKGCAMYIAGNKDIINRIRVPKEVVIITSINQFLQKIKAIQAK